MSGYPLLLKAILKISMFLSNMNRDKFIFGKCSASPFTNSFFTLGGKCK